MIAHIDIYMYMCTSIYIHIYIYMYILIWIKLWFSFYPKLLGQHHGHHWSLVALWSLIDDLLKAIMWFSYERMHISKISSNTEVHCALDNVPWALCIVQCALCAVHCTLYTVHCILNTARCTLYTIHCVLYTVHCTLYFVHRALCTVHRTPTYIYIYWY